jgi:hypothetical protein
MFTVFLNTPMIWAGKGNKKPAEKGSLVIN